MNPTSLPQLLEYICTRPQMFVADGSFRSVSIYLDGYTEAIQRLTGKSRDETEWNGFRLWLADRCHKSHGIDRNLGWQSYIAALYPDDEARFEQLPILFNEYRSWLAEGHDPLSFYLKRAECPWL